jgi:hypothetical protein
MKMFSLIIALASVFSLNSAFADNKIDPRPADRINCTHDNNPTVTMLYSVAISNEKDSVKIEVVWNVGKCTDIKEGKGRASRFVNKARFFLNDAEEIDGLNISSEKIENSKYVKTTITMPETIFSLGNKFSLHLTTGLFGSSKWNFEINEVFKNDGTKYSIEYLR